MPSEAHAPISVYGFDHLVLRCADVEASLDFYSTMLGLPPVRVDEWREGLAPFPSIRVSEESIIDLIPADPPPKEDNVDHFCLVTTRAAIDAIDADRDRFRVVDGPDVRFGARGNGWSVYILDPDDNVIELRTYESEPAAH